VGVLAAHPDMARQGILLRKFGQEVIRVTAGKRVHGTGSIPGGVNKRITVAERDELRRRCPTCWPGRRPACAGGRAPRANRALYEHFGTVRSSLLSLVGRDGKLDLYDGVLRARDADGAIIFDGVSCEDYGDAHPRERALVELHEVPVHRRAGAERGWYKVGPLARIQNCDAIGTPLAEAARQELRPAPGRRPSFTRRWRSTGRG
jgi:NAD-reducing hydrogenase large subunit